MLLKVKFSLLLHVHSVLSAYSLSPKWGRFYRNVLIKKNYPHHGAVAFGHYGKAIFDTLKYLGVEDLEFNRPAGMLYDGENPYAKY